MGMPRKDTHRLVKSEDLNHHSTLFAGRAAEWFVESAFVAASAVLDPARLVCVKIHGMHFQHPVRSGRTVRLSSRLVLAGRTSLVCHVGMTVTGSEEAVVDGFVSFVHVDAETRPAPHGLVVVPGTEEEGLVQAEAARLVELSKAEGGRRGV